MAWGDYDGDGDLDLLLAGLFSGTTAITRVYRNDGGTFVDIGASLMGVESGACAWVDYDRDGDLDLFLSGTVGGPPSRIYRNDGVAEFADIGATMRSVYQSAAAWGDVDNDGDPDLILAGTDSSVGDVARLYRNDGGDSFTELPIATPGFRRGSLDLADYDGDGDLDLLVTGLRGPASRSTLYRNDGGTFTETLAPFLDVHDGEALWGDYDQDGDFDVLLDGSDSTDTHVFTRIYRNTAGVLTDALLSLPGAGEGSDLAWGDVENDGDLDFAVTALNFGETDVLRNDGGAFVATGTDLVDVCCGAIGFGDYDRDGDLDLLITGLPDVTRLYRNQAATANAAPSPPSGLAATVQGNELALSWGPGSDLETPAAALTYNLRVGRTAGGVEVVPPMADPASGFRRVVAFGNVGHERAWPLRGLPNGNYFWSVQAVDAAFAGSPFALETSFTIGPTTAVGDGAPSANGGLRVTRPFPNPWRGEGTIAFELGAAARVELEVYDAMGHRMATQASHLDRGAQRLRWPGQDLPSGLYFYRLRAGSESVTGRVVVLHPAIR